MLAPAPPLLQTCYERVRWAPFWPVAAPQTVLTGLSRLRTRHSCARHPRCSTLGAVNDTQPTSPPASGPAAAGFRAELGPRDFTLLVIGGVIGDGVYVVSALGAERMGPAQLVAWAVAGVLAALIALAFVQCSMIHPVVGGSYAYTRAAFGRFLGFMAGWALYVGEFVALPVFPLAFVNYLGLLLPGLPGTPAALVVKAGLIALVTGINLRGVRTSGLLNDVLTLVKLVPLAAFILLGLAFLGLRPAAAAEHLQPFAPLGFGGLGAAVLLVFWAYAGFELSVLPAAEVREPQRTLPRGLMVGMTVATVVYLLVALGVVVAMPWTAAAGSPHPLADAAAAAFTGFGWPAGVAQTLAALGALVSIASVFDVYTLAVARLSYALAADGLFPRPFAHLDARRGTPTNGLLFQGTAALVFSSVFDLAGLLSGAVCFLGICYCFTALSALRLGARRPDLRLHVPARRPLLVLAALGAATLTLQAPPPVLAAAAGVMAAGAVVYAARSPRWRDARALAGEFQHGEAAFEQWLQQRERWLLRSFLRR